MAVTQVGTTLIIGGQRTLSSYIVVSDSLGANVVTEEIEDATGVLTTIIVFRNEATINLSLISKTGAAPVTDFPKGAKCAISALSSYFVDEVSIERTKSAERTNVTLRLIGV